jgi:hypothetical protein
VEQAYINYFQDIFTTSNLYNIDACIESIEGRLMNTMKDSLMATYMAEEVYGALLQMAPFKSPGPDGFSADFYQQN